LLNFNYLEAKLTATDANALIADYDYLLEDKDLQLVQSALGLSANVIARDPRQLAGQLTGRLLQNASPKIHGEVSACMAARDNRTIVAGDDLGGLHFLQIIEADESRPAIGDTKIPILECQGGRLRFFVQEVERKRK